MGDSFSGLKAGRNAPLILPLDRVAEAQRGLVGGKAANLAVLLRAQLPVPTGFCVTAAAFSQFFLACPRRDELLRVLARGSTERPDDFLPASACLQASLSEAPIPAAVELAILAAWRQQGTQRAYAVRSSATVEDAADHSFAGQFESCLHVRGEAALLAAIKKCWLSLFSARALAYQAKQGLPAERAAMAVVVQEMVSADASGVLFTADPVSGDARRMVIEAVAGLGDQLVAGRVNPDCVLLEKATGRIVRPRATIDALCLGETLVRKLGALGLAAEQHFGAPQDLEWASSNGQVFLLQARPITALPTGHEAEPDVWTNANVIEALPEVVTPMSWSLMQILLHDFLEPLAVRLGLGTSRRPLVDLIAGRAYFNVRGLAALLRRLGPLPLDISAALGGQLRDLQAANPPARFSLSSWCTPRAAVRALRLAAWLLPGLVRQQRVIERWRERVFGELPLTPFTSLSDEALARCPQTLFRLASTGAGERTWAAVVWMGLGALGGSMAVFHFARRWLDDRDGSLANRLLSGAGNMNSAENGLALCRLAAWVKAHPPVAQAVLAPGAFADLERRLASVVSGPEFLEGWRAFLRNHGHQGRGGMDVAQPRWSERPDHVLDLLRVFLQMPAESDPLGLQAQRLEARARLVADCRRRLRNPLKRGLFLLLLRASHRGLAQRENVKNEGVRLVAFLRQVLFEAGRRLADRGVLRRMEDVFFLKLEELEPALCGRPAFDLQAVVAARQSEHVRLEQLSPPPLIVGRFEADSAPGPALDPETKVLQGVGASPGVVTGLARVILQADANERVRPGEILVAPYTDPGWTPYFLAAAGIVVDIGGLLSHGSVVAREYGLPAVVNVGPATRLIRTGDRLQVDGNRGQVTRMNRI